MGWPVAAPERSAPRTGKGAPWIPANHADVLTSPTFQPRFDRPEIAEYFTQPIPGPAVSPLPGSPLPGSPAPGATPAPDPTPTSWRAIFYDSPRTLRPKLALARTSQFAGAGFWAIGYERGLTGYLELMSDFRAGNVVPDEVLLGELDRLTDR
jgi:hypothetical protein